ncbi:hypothetical protein [Variovorax rhizosphaerae]|uniref:Uncharacterized protein n=1 Tax=Variovorax rhizosphaerae TaxID=1836200 RepID=A0ABU8WZ61_9BURK
MASSIGFAGRVTCEEFIRSVMNRKVPPLRRLAIHVEEPRRGAFQWILSEVDEAATLIEVERAKSRAKTYRQAMADGLRALQAMVDDLDVGPRSQQAVEQAPSARAAPAPATPREDDSPSEPAAVVRPTHSMSEPRHKATAFGFGLPS